MVVLDDEAKAREICEYNVRKDALEEGAEKGRNEEREKGDPTAKMVKRIIDRCIEENVLADFLTSHRKEVEDILIAQYDEEKEREIYEYNVRKDALEEIVEKGRDEGRN